MDNPMLQLAMRDILESCYGITPQLKFLMRPHTHTLRLLITKEILKQYTFFADAFGSKHAAFYHEIASLIDEHLNKYYGPDSLAQKRSYLRNCKHTPPNRPDFLKQLFSPYFPVDE